MTDLVRLRALLRGAAGPPVPSRQGAVSVDLPAFAARLGGALEQTTLGPCPVVRRWLDGSERDGPYGARLREAAGAISETGVRVLAGGDPPSWSGADPTAGLVFVDLETTGLSGGSGTVAFVVGFGCFEGSRFHVWQYVLPSFGGERRLLAAVSAAAARAHTLVTFNGKSFDLPFMEMRWLFHRLETPLARLRHLDLLHPARRLWGPETGGLNGLEARVLGFGRPDDVPGFEIPARYFDYLRSGDPAPIRGVLLHNQLDLASLAVLTAVACRLADGGPPATLDARQCLGLGRVYERAGRRGVAVECYERAAGASREGAGDPATRAEALFRVATAHRRQRRHAEAAEAWQRLLALGRPTGAFEREALRALAIHHEHRLKNAEAALRFARRAHAGERAAGRLRDGERRVSRLERRLAH